MANRIRIDPVHIEPYKEIYDDFSNLENSLSANLDELYRCFEKLLTSFKKIGSYDKSTWNYHYTNIWWERIRQISLSPRGVNLRAKLKSKIDNEDNEAWDFFYLEMVLADAKTSDYYKEITYFYYKKYPHNYEMMHNYAHSLCQNDSSLEDVKKSITLYRCYIDAYIPLNSPYAERYPEKTVHYAYNVEMQLFRRYREKDDIENAKLTLDSIAQYPPFRSHSVYGNHTATISEMFTERLYFVSLVKKSEDNLKQTVEKYQIEQSKSSVQQLSIFSAIITFIMTAANFGMNTSEGSSFSFIINIGLILLIFVVTTQILLYKPKRFFDIRVVIFILFSLALFLNILGLKF